MLGKINFGKILLIYVPFIIVTPFYCYYKAVSTGQQKPYPSATITQTACHYPQDIAFRFFMLIASSLLALIFYVVFRWCQFMGDRAKFYKKISKPLYYIAQFSILLYGITIGTIDGKSTGPLHSPCAVGFFLILIIAIVQITLFLTELRSYDTRVLSKNSLLIKQIFAIFLVVLWVYCLGMIIAVSSQMQDIQGKGDKYVVIVQWNTVTVGLLWVLSFCLQWKNINLCLVSPSQKKKQIFCNRQYQYKNNNYEQQNKEHIIYK